MRSRLQRGARCTRGKLALTQDLTGDDITSTPSTPSGITDPVELLQRIATTAGGVQRQRASASTDRLKPLVVELDDTLRRLETLLGKISSL